ncbi:O-antigen ligase family protein [bacterium]|nr:O-antigen ligase family protein [bacterium]
MQGKKVQDKSKKTSAHRVASLIIFSGLLILIFFRPLISGITWKWSNTYFQLLILFLIGVWLLRMVLEGRITFLKTPLDLPILAFSIALIVSTIKTVHRQASLEQFYQFMSYPLLYYLFINILRERKEITAVISTILAVAILVSLYGIYQNYIALEETREWVRIYHSGQFSSQFMSRLGTHKVFSTFVYPPALAGYLSLVFPLAFCFLIYAQSKWMRILSGLTLVSGGLCLYFTYSKGGWVAAFLSMIFLFAILLCRKMQSKGCDYREKIRRYGPLILIFLLILIIPFLFPAIREFLLEHEPFNHLEGFFGSLTVRVDYWKAGLGMLRDYPVFGSGLGTFGTLYAKYKLPQGREVQLAHNNYLQVWTEMGILGIVSFLWLWIVFLKRGWRLINRLRGTEAAVAVGCYVGVVAFLIHSLVDFDLYVPGIAMNVWLFLALTTSYGEGRRQWKAKILAHSRIVGVVIIILAMTAAMLIVRRPMLAENHFSRANNYLQAQRELPKESYRQLKGAISSQSFPLKSTLFQGKVARFSQEDMEKAASGLGIKPENAKSINEFLRLPYKEMAKLLYSVFLTKAEEELKQALTFNPKNSTYHYQLGSIYEKRGNFYKRTSLKEADERLWIDKAIAEYEKAITCNPFMPHYHSTLGKILWDKAKGKDKALIKRAISEFEEAVLCYPTKARYRAFLGRVYQLTGRKEEAQKQYKKAVELDQELSDPALKQVRIWLKKLSQ